MTNGPHVSISADAVHPGGLVAVCSCGWSADQLTDAVTVVELHAAQCGQHRQWAHDRIEILPYILGVHVPVQVLELLHQLVGTPPALLVINEWLSGVEDRPEFDG